MDMVAVGAIDARSVWLWIRSSRPGYISVRWWPEGRKDYREAHVDIPPDNDRDNTCIVQVPPGSATGERLEPLTRYRYHVLRSDDESVIGEGTFETAPGGLDESPRSWSIGLISCHQPFDESGCILPSAPQMLRAVRRCFEAHDVKFVLMVGDQIYADHPPSLSLFDPDHFSKIAPPGRSSILECSPEEVRRLYHRRYRHFWNLPELQAIQARFPCYMMLDDHDVVNNWGSNPAHREPPWQQVRRGALHAFADYQVRWPVPIGEDLPEDFHYSFSYGHSAVFVMDVRTGRRAGSEGRLISEAQFHDLQAFLETNGDKSVLLLVSSVPIIHVPARLARIGARLPAWGEDFSDRWSALAHLRDRDRLIELIGEHQQQYPRQCVLLVSGDIHIGSAHRIRWRESGAALYQLISSPVTHVTPGWVQLVSQSLIRLKRQLATRDGSITGDVKLLEGTDGSTKNPYRGLNVGIIEMDTPGPAEAPAVRFLLYGQRDGEPVCVYRSPRL